MPSRARASLLLLAAALTGCVTSDPLLPSGSGGSDDDGPSGPGTGAGSEGGGGEGAGVGGGAPVVCGDDVCDLEETCDTCPGDCSCTGPACGDGSCDVATEDCDTCAADCGPCPVCGDDVCEDPAEDCDTCFQDCGVCACAPDAFEPNGGSTTATPVAFGVDYCDLSVCTTDVDWLELEVNDGFTATLTFFQLEGNLDLEIYSGITGDYVTGSYSNDDDESVTLSGLAAGTYWARIYGKMGAENPDYCFRADP